MKLQQLRHFVTLSEEMHFGRAAKRLCITQPPLSLSISQLEESLGVRLFERDSKHVAITVAGQALLEKVREIVYQADRTVDFAKAIVNGRVGRIELGFTGSLVHRGLPEIIHAFTGSHPDIELSMREANSQRQTELVRSGRMDAGFVNMSVPPAGLESLIIYAEKFVVCLPAKHRLAKASSIAMEALRDEYFILISRESSPSYYDQLIAFCTAAGFRPKIRIEVAQILSKVALVASGLGVALVPESVARAGMAGIVFVPVAGCETRPNASLVWNPQRSTPALDALIETTRAKRLMRRALGEQPSVSGKTR
jgi:DNA-binding transcriptional LysR family regulator